MRRLRLASLALALLLGACAGFEPLEDLPAAGEMKPGPGAFTGADGEWVIMSNGGSDHEEKEQD